MPTELFTHTPVGCRNLKPYVVAQNSHFHVVNEVRKELKEKETSLTLLFKETDNPGIGLSETIRLIIDACWRPPTKMPQEGQVTEMNEVSWK